VFLLLGLVFCVSVFSNKNSINSLQISTPTVKAISGNCQNPASYIILYNLPSKGKWTLTQYPKDTSIVGRGSNFALLDVPKGDYKFVVTDSMGNKSDTTKIVTITPSFDPPAAPLIKDVVQPTAIEPSATVVLKGLPVGKDGPWILYISPNNLNFSGSDSIATILGLSYGDYSFSVENSSHCLSTPTKVSIKSVVTFDSSTTSLPSFSVSVFPNPATDEIVISSQGIQGVATKFQIMNQQGILVESGCFTNETTVKVAHFVSGLYLVSFDNGSKVKFIKK